MPISAKTLQRRRRRQRKRKYQKVERFSKFFAIISTPLKCQVQVNFPEMEFLETEPNFTSTKEKFVEVCLRPP